VGHDLALWVKHENHLPTNAFKARNALSVMTALPDDERRRGVVAATRGNHGAGVAYAGSLLGVPVTICVPEGNNVEKNEAMRAFGAELVEQGRDYDEAVTVAEALVRERGLRMIHSTNDAQVIAGAATMTLEILEEQPELDALVVAVGGGSQAVGALVVARALRPDLAVYGVQAAGAAAIHDAWHSGKIVGAASARTFADGLATRNVYEMTFPTLQDGLAGFAAVSEADLASAVRLILRATHNLVEGAGAAGVAGAIALGEQLQGKRVGVVLSGANIDAVTLRQILAGEL
jgi:threonine dehydratase